MEEVRTSIARGIEKYDHDRPYRGVLIARPTKPFRLLQVVLNSETLTVF